MQYLTCFRLITAALFLALASMPALGQGGFSRQINGQVRYADSRAPAENVLIRLESVSGGLAGQTVTDRTGKFSFSGLRAEQFHVVAHAPGYLDVQQTVELMTSPTGYVNFQLVRDPAAVLTGKELSPGIIDAGVPFDAQSEYAKGKELLDEGKEVKTREAVRHFEEALAVYPSFYEARLTLGLAEMDLAEWGKAEKELLAAIEINKEGATAYVALGDVYRRQKKYAESEKTLLEGLKHNADSAEGHAMLAAVYWETARSAGDEQAIKNRLQNSWIEVNKALKLKSSLADAQLLAGNLLMKARRGEEALKHFEAYLRLQPKGRAADEVRAMVEKLKQALAEGGKKAGK
jgi:hypothetical protein